MRHTHRPTDFDFAEDLTAIQAIDLEEALDKALDAMASYSPLDTDNMHVIAALLLNARIAKHEALARDERERYAKEEEKS